MIVQINESGLEALMLEMLPEIGYKEQHMETPIGCRNFLKELAQIGEDYEKCTRSLGYKRHNSFDYWVTVVNQLGLKWAGRCDILLSYYAGGFVNDKEEGVYYKKAVIIELKKGKIDSNTINQALRYKRYIQSLGCYSDVECVLVGTDVCDVDFVLESIRDNVSIWTCNYKADGIQMNKYIPSGAPKDLYETRAENCINFLNGIYKRSVSTGMIDLEFYPTLERFVGDDEILNELYKTAKQ